MRIDDELSSPNPSPNVLAEAKIIPKPRDLDEGWMQCSPHNFSGYSLWHWLFLMLLTRVQACSSWCVTVEIILKVMLLEGWCQYKRMGHGRSLMTWMASGPGGFSLYYWDKNNLPCISNADSLRSILKLKVSHQVGPEHLTSMYDHLDWEDKDGCYNSSLFRSTMEFKSFTEVRNWKKWHKSLVKKGSYNA